MGLYFWGPEVDSGLFFNKRLWIVDFFLAQTIHAQIHRIYKLQCTDITGPLWKHTLLPLTFRINHSCFPSLLKGWINKTATKQDQKVKPHKSEQHWKASYLFSILHFSLVNIFGEMHPLYILTYAQRENTVRRLFRVWSVRAMLTLHAPAVPAAAGQGHVRTYSTGWGWSHKWKNSRRVTHKQFKISIDLSLHYLQLPLSPCASF